MRNFFSPVAVGLVLVLLSCTRNEPQQGDPKKLLSEYISRTFAVRGPDDRQQMMEFLTGDAKSRLSAWSEDQFKQAFIDSKRQFIKLVFQEVKPLSPTETSITYELSYLDQNRGIDAKVTNRKLCQLQLEQGKWRIADVRNIKELVEYKNELSLP